MNQPSSARLHAGIEKLGLILDPPAEQRLLDYLELLSKWNRVYNLTAIRDESEMVSQHLLDSLAVLSYLNGNSIRTLADVGSGGGLPGIPLAIARPQIKVALIESSQKKASFLQQVKIELGLKNVSVHCLRIQDFKTSELFDRVISRAFSSLKEFVFQSSHLLAAGGRLLAMKGIHPKHEIADLPSGWQIRQVIPLQVPELEAQRHLIVIEKA
ncbi:MAG: 16S rRNA (guanine(527)-N(7))-methyltransferase RsmG [Betaproteobacteria bacterium]|nr:16S rRNA (guanine(527)-N(7))-methyltransferase RsmG [Betaproteobacteria bacterium]